MVPARTALAAGLRIGLLLQDVLGQGYSPDQACLAVQVGPLPDLPITILQSELKQANPQCAGGCVALLAMHTLEFLT
jgi:hypothetical protein